MNLFKQNKRQLLTLLKNNKNELAKYYFDIDDFPIVNIAPNAIIQLVNIVKDKPLLRATFFGRNEIENLLELFGNKYQYHNYRYLTGTFNPNAHPETTSVDGSVSRVADEALATIIAGAGTNSSDIGTTGGGTPILTASATSNQYVTLARGIFLFDTSSLGNAIISTITPPVFSVYIDGGADKLGQSLSLTSANPASNTALVNADYAVANFGSTKFATDITLATIVANLNAYTDWTLNASGITAISLTGITKFALRMSSDVSGSATWGANENAFITPYFADAGSNKPKLVVTYTPLGGSFLFNFC